MEKLSVSVNQTLKLGKRIAAHLVGGEVILLYGDLGAGKTVLAKGIAQGLGVNKHDVVSPTFVLLRIYQGKHLLQHFDFYRISSPEDIFALGYEEYFYPRTKDFGVGVYSDAVTVIEWPQRMKFLLPKEFLKIKLITKAENKRCFKFLAKGSRYKKLLERINESRTF